MGEAASERTRAALRLGILALLVLSPLPFGSVEPYAVLVIEIWSACLGAVAVSVVLRDPKSLPSGARAVLLAPCALVLVGLVQLVPLPGAWTWLPTSAARAALEGMVPEASPRYFPWSLSPPDTLDAVLRLVAYTALGVAAVVAFRGLGSARRVALAITASGAFQAVYGAAEYLSGHRHIFGYAKKYYLDEATGTFINRNHFAGFLAMSLPFALSLASSPRGAGEEPGTFRKRLLRWLDSGRLTGLLAALAAVCMWLGVLLSYSRTGLAAAAASTTVFLFLARPSRVRALVLVGTLLLPTVLLLWVEVRAPGERFGTVGTELASGAGRLAVWRTTLGLVARHPIVGYGLGTFESAYAPHQTAAARGRYDHAHNDWLESFVEGGAVAFLAVLALLFFTVRPALRAAREVPRNILAARAAALAGVTAIALHSVTDFCLRIPAIAILLAVLLALLVRSVHDAAQTERGNLMPFRGSRVPSREREP